MAGVVVTVFPGTQICIYGTLEHAFVAKQHKHFYKIHHLVGYLVIYGCYVHKYKMINGGNLKLP